MTKTHHKKISKKSLPTVNFSEPLFLAFIMVFSVIGTYTYLRSFAAEDGSVLIQTTAGVSPEEQAILSSISWAAVAILAAGPVAVLILWWIWRRSDMAGWLKLSLTAAPVLAVMAFA